MSTVAALVLTASGGPFLDATPEEMAAVTPAQALQPPDLDDGRQDHDRLGDPRQQGPGGHRGALAVRCRLRRDRGRHPPAERRPLRRPVRRRLPEGPAGHPGYATSDPVRHDLSRPPAIAGRATRPDRDRPARLPGARHDALPGAAHRARGRAAGPARVGRADRRRRRRGRAFPRRHARLRRASRACSRPPSTRFGASGASGIRTSTRSSRSTPKSAPRSRAAAIGAPA